MKAVPNGITLGRIGLSVLLLFFKPLGPAFLAIYICCGLTDWLDGLIARKTGTTSSLGAKLDSVADMMLTAIAFITLYPVLELSLGILLWILLIGIIRVASILTALYKFRTYASIHTYGNKLTGLILFVTPLWLSTLHQSVWFATVCMIATLSALEELIILITSSELKLNRKGLCIRQTFTDQC